MSAHRLYTPDVLAAAVSLATYPLSGDLPFSGEARSKSCGSRIELGLALREDGVVERIGIASRACAIGQASAAVFAAAAKGRSADEIASTTQAMTRWLDGPGPMPDWPGLSLIAPARDYPARHGAMMLPWNAACDALGLTGDVPRG